MEKQTVIGLGLAALGRPDYINIRTNKQIDKSLEAFKKNASDLLDYAYKSGIKNFDTAPSYGKGEQFLIDWHKKNNFKDVSLSTKWGYTYMANWEIGYKEAHEIKEHSLDKLNEQWTNSKILLNQLEIYQVHSATIESGILDNQEVLKRLLQIKNKNNIKIGITTSGTNQSEVIKKALDIKYDDVPLFDSFQVTFNILEQSAYPILSTLIQSGKTVIIKEGLANGRIFSVEDIALEKLLNDLSIKYKVGKDAIALRYIIDQLNPNILLSGASNKTQLDQNLKVSNFQLNNEELSRFQKLASNSIDYWKDRKALEWS